jgi:hypothetical protein
MRVNRAAYAEKWWARRKKAYFATHPRRCAKCGVEKKIVLHHVRYDRFGGKELDEDLLALCSKHHDALHRLGKRKGWTIPVTTANFMAKKDPVPRTSKPVIISVPVEPHPLGSRPRKKADKVARSLPQRAPARSVLRIVNTPAGPQIRSNGW